jgi:iron(III) transport system permease protein
VTRDPDDHHRVRRFAWDSLPGLLVTVILLAPLVLVWIPAAAPEEMPGEAARIAWPAFGASLAVAFAAAVLAVIIGGLLAAVLVLTDLPGRGFWATAFVLPFVCPPLVWAMGQVYCYGSGGLMERWLGGAWRGVLACSDRGHYLATTLVLAEIHAPLAMLIVGRGMGRLNQAGLEAARLFLSPLALARWIAGAVRPEAMASLLLVLALALGNLAVPHVMQCRLYPIEVYARMANYLDAPGALWTALPLLLATLVAVAGVAVLERRSPAAMATPAPPPVSIPLGRKVWAVAALLAIYLGLTSLLPLAALLVECRSLAFFFEAARTAARETENSLEIGLAASLVAAVAGLIVGVWAAKRTSLAVHLAAIVPLGVPAMILGLAYLRFYNRTWPIDLTGLGNTGALVVLALAARGWPFVTRAVAAGQQRIAPEWRDAAQLAGLGWARRWRWITGPLVADHAVAGALVAFILAVGDVEISQMLCAPGSGTLALRLFSFLHFGPTHVAANLAVLQLALATAPLALYLLITNRCPRIV